MRIGAFLLLSRTMPRKEIVITKEGLERLENELNELMSVKRPEIINRIKTAKELGDLSENAEYTAAKEEQSFIEGRIQELEGVIKHAKVVNGNGQNNSGVIGVGSKVTVEIAGQRDTFEIVGPTESDPTNGKISIDSPVGQALLSHRAKESVSVETPDGKVAYKIIAVA